jgi:hypothetical protein
VKQYFEGRKESKLLDKKNWGRKSQGTAEEGIGLKVARAGLRLHSGYC